jgi:hypothetical protein
MEDWKIWKELAPCGLLGSKFKFKHGGCTWFVLSLALTD